MITNVIGPIKEPIVLDLFCGAGGAAKGYSNAGFTVIGIDIARQPNYPFEFHQMGWREGLERFGKNVHLVHASPPCQAYSRMNRAARRHHPDLIPYVRMELARNGVPYVIENVEGAPLITPILLCGTMVGIPVRRHRLFELSGRFFLQSTQCGCRNGVVSGRLIGHRVSGRVAPGRRKPPKATEADRRKAIGVEWMSCREARQAIPPAYTEWLGRRIREELRMGGMIIPEEVRRLCLSL